jgi:hypothetical protein
MTFRSEFFKEWTKTARFFGETGKGYHPKSRINPKKSPCQQNDMGFPGKK